MGDPRGFLNIQRKESGYRPVEERIGDYREVEVTLSEEERKDQAARCMDCGVPFCHWGCPLGNVMPEWQDMIFKGDWNTAYDILNETNNFPEFTGRVCPAPCEASCVLAITNEPVTIRQNERAVAEKAFESGYVKPTPPAKRTGKKVAVIGSGPAGLACADLLNKQGHSVTVFEASDKVGGYLRYGIPDFKLEKTVIDRRVDVLREEGIEFKTSTNVGIDVKGSDILNDYDAVMLAIGARTPRDLPVEGRDLEGVHFAMEYLEQKNRMVSGESFSDEELIATLNKKVVVIGGGDTGSDCVGNANRQGANSISQIEIMPEAPSHRTEEEPWPLWPRLSKNSSSHEEGCARDYQIMTKKFIGEKGKLKKILACKVEWTKNEDGSMSMKEVAGSDFEMEADVALLAMGFVHAVHEGLVSELGVSLSDRGNLEVDENFMTSVDGVFSGGDASRGASLVVWAIAEGRKAAEGINKYLSK